MVKELGMRKGGNERGGDRRLGGAGKALRMLS